MPGFYDGKDSAGASEGSISMRYVSTRAMALKARYCPGSRIAPGLAVLPISTILVQAARPGAPLDGSGASMALRRAQPTRTA